MRLAREDGQDQKTSSTYETIRRTNSMYASCSHTRVSGGTPSHMPNLCDAYTKDQSSDDS